MMTDIKPPTILVTGVTGYIGGQIVPRLLEEGYTVRAMTRGGRERLAGRPWVDQVEVVKADVLEPDTLRGALDGVQAAYYLIHSMQDGDKFAEQDMEAACNFARAATEAGVEQVIYLSGLGDPDDDLSVHLRSRQETGQRLRECGEVPVTEFRAAAVIGSGSLSFEILRYLTERVPFMICPRWVETRMQPIAVHDVLNYLVAALVTPQSKNEIIEIGGSDVVNYRDMMQTYADVRHLKRLMVPVPFFTPRLSSYWVHLITPVPASIAQPLIDGMHNEVVVRDSKAKEIFPDIHPIDFVTALTDALQRVESGH
ncbi:MAG: NmrA family NAD(P)-binding protein, partial [Anaerolineae bacterium]|nr:NmrA family NAD(P)-binding protein [Anaerolineae bacterium]